MTCLPPLYRASFQDFPGGSGSPQEGALALVLSLSCSLPPPEGRMLPWPPVTTSKGEPLSKHSEHRNQRASHLLVCLWVFTSVRARPSTQLTVLCSGSPLTPHRHHSQQSVSKSTLSHPLFLPSQRAPYAQCPVLKQSEQGRGDEGFLRPIDC